jgi:hypothetical protein
MIIPSAYTESYPRARAVDAAKADLYMRHVHLGDPAADDVVRTLHALGGARRGAIMQAGIEGGPMAIPDAPENVRAFFARMDTVPDWYDPEFALLGSRAFYRNSNMFLAAFVGAVLIEGFSTLISKSFGITGMIIDQGVRRLKQNNRHVAEIFLPGGLARHADGWKLSVRIRMIHAQVRFLLSKSEEWEYDAWGGPLSAAHVAYGAATFSAVLLKNARALGVKVTEDESAAFMMIWRYAASLMGIVPEMLFENEQHALELNAIGNLCEPPPSIESCHMVHALINGAAILAGMETPADRHKMTKKIYRISRALIGDERADALRYPPAITFGALPLLRTTNRAQQLLNKYLPSIAPMGGRRGQFEMMLSLSNYDADGIRYRVPESHHAEKDAQR